MKNEKMKVRGVGRRAAALAACLGALLMVASAGAAEIATDRPAPADRLFRSAAVDACVDEVVGKLTNPKLARFFANCLPNTLDTTVHYRQTADGEDDTYVYAGDVRAMWLRDSSAQVWPYLRFVRQDEPLRRMIRGVLLRQFGFIAIDAYANAFNDTGNETKGWQSDLTEMRPGVHERKWELDSLCYVLRLAHGYWKASGDTTVFDARWTKALDAILAVLHEQQRKEGPFTSYRFQRTHPSFKTHIPNDGWGWPVKPVGLVYSAFRPSDDGTHYGFLVPSNFFAVDVLRRAAEILTAVNGDTARAGACAALADEIEAALEKYAVVTRPDFGAVYAYEVDGRGNALFMDDANIPSLLALPYFSGVKATDPIYRNTRALVWSEANPYYCTGPYAGIGGPHQGIGTVWPLAYIAKALTTDDDAEIRACLEAILASDDGTCVIRETVKQDDATTFTRIWYSWANTLFGELILKLLDEGKLDLLNSVGVKGPVRGIFASVAADVSALPEAAKFVGQLVETRVSERTSGGAGASLTVAFALDPSVPGEEARVSVRGGRAEIRAGRTRGLVFGAGALLKRFTYRADRFSVKEGETTFKPWSDLRIAYLARHFLNWYMEASDDELIRYIDDIALDGVNAFKFQVTMAAPDRASFSDAEAAAFAATSRKMAARVAALDCAVVEGGGSNQLPQDSPECFRAVPNENPKHPNLGFNACPAKPDALQAIVDFHRNRLAATKDLNVGYLVSWPYDEGGCGCDACMPWGGRGYLALAEKLNALNRSFHPQAKAIVSAWYFTQADYDGLWKYLESHDWIDYVLIDDFGSKYPEYPLKHKMPGRAKILTFPEISMWGQGPWGGYGMNALPKHLEDLFRQSEPIAGGCMYYSEGVYEDVNKFLETELYINPKQTADAILARYAAYYLAGVQTRDFVRLAHLLEANHSRGHVTRANATAARKLATRMDGEILPSLRGSWRWRLIFLRTLVDDEIARAGDNSPKAAYPYFDEIVKIYHSERQVARSLDGYRAGWTCPRYEPAGCRKLTFAPPEGEATQMVQGLLNDRTRKLVRLGPGTWRMAPVDVIQGRFEVALDAQTRLVDLEGRPYARETDVFRLNAKFPHVILTRAGKEVARGKRKE